jgi:catecholate siderophore receptor
MSFIKTRKKIVSSAIASSLSVVAVPAIAQDDVSHLPTIHAEATTDNLKVDNLQIKNMLHPFRHAKICCCLSQKLLQDTGANSLTQALQNDQELPWCR